MLKCDRCKETMEDSAKHCLFPTSDGMRITHDISTCVELMSEALKNAMRRIEYLENIVEG
jgi:hypothetical protein